MFIHASHLLNCAHTQILERASCYRQKQHLKFVNILMRYMFSFQRLGNYFEYRHNHHIHPKNLNNFSGHKQAWYSFEVLTKLVFSIIGASMSPTKSKIHQHFSPLLCFRKMVPVGRRESPCRSMTYGSSVIGMNSWIQHRDSHLHFYSLVHGLEVSCYICNPPFTCAFSKHQIKLN